MFCYSYCVSFSVLLDGVWLTRNKTITYLLTYLLTPDTSYTYSRSLTIRPPVRSCYLASYGHQRGIAAAVLSPSSGNWLAVGCRWIYDAIARSVHEQDAVGPYASLRCNVTTLALVAETLMILQVFITGTYSRPSDVTACTSEAPETRCTVPRRSPTNTEVVTSGIAANLFAA